MLLAHVDALDDDTADLLAILDAFNELGAEDFVTICMVMLKQFEGKHVRVNVIGRCGIQFPGE